MSVKEGGRVKGGGGGRGRVKEGGGGRERVKEGGGGREGGKEGGGGRERVLLRVREGEGVHIAVRVGLQRMRRTSRWIHGGSTRSAGRRPDLAILTESSSQVSEQLRTVNWWWRKYTICRHIIDHSYYDTHVK